MKTWPINLESKIGIQEVMANAEEILMKATYNFEEAVEQEKNAREIYIDGFSSVFLSLLSGEQKVGDKRVPPSVCEKTARALCSDSYYIYENACRESKKREEVMNSIKKLLDQRTRLGG